MAKLRMLAFYYDLIDKFRDRCDFQLLELDILDSLYLAFITPTLHDAVRPEMRKQFYSEWGRWLPVRACPSHKQNFIDARSEGRPYDMTSQCLDYKNISLFDKQTPGLFKTEYSGDGFVGCAQILTIVLGRGREISLVVRV